MSKVKYAMFTLVTTVLFLVASASSVFACNIWSYQPETPKCLLK